MVKSTILVIDDEKDLLELLRGNLQRDGFEVLTASDGKAGLEAARSKLPNLIILDLMMPGLDGLEVCREVRRDERTRSIPIIMLTAKAAEADRVVGLELGADDYVVKPFSPRELVARVKAHLRRAVSIRENCELRVGPLMIDPSRHRVALRGQPASLTAAEFRILHLLMSRAGVVLSRQQIISAVLGTHAAVTDRTIDVHITSLRRKLGDGGDLIETVRGFGYRLKDQSEQ
jgi:two-component system phosphate regulon response regulator PhoB